MSTVPAVDHHHHHGHDHYQDHHHDPEHHHDHRVNAAPVGGSKRRRIGVAIAGAWLVSGVYIVPADQQAVVARFGQVIEPRIFPGIHMALPWPMDRVTRLKVQQLQRLVVGGDLPDSVLGRTQPLASQFLTGDQNIINLRAVVQYSVGVPADYLFRAQDVSKTVAAAVETEMARRIGRRTVDAVLTTEKTAIQEEVRAAAQELIDAYGTGVRIASVNIESMTPPLEATEAFRDVASARADAARIYNEALGYESDLVPKARGEARQMTESATAYKESKINEAMGDAARFDLVEGEYAHATAVNGRRLYLETLEQVLPKIKKLVVDKNGSFDLTIIRKGGDSAPQRKNP